MADVRPEAVLSVAISVWDPSDDDEPVASATLIEPTLAVTAAGALSPTLKYSVAFANGLTDTALVAFEIPNLRLVTLNLDVAKTVLPIGDPVAGPCVSMWPRASKDLTVQQGRISLTGSVFSVQFDTPAETPPKGGAPIVVEGQLVGILDSDARTVIPAKQVAAALHPPEMTDEYLFSLLDGSARRALAHASGIARYGTVHSEHLVLGLFENPDGSTRRLLTGRGIDEQSLRRALIEAVKTTPRGGDDYVLARLAALPRVSKHVREALRIAAATATANGNLRIRGRHLFFGLVSVKDCEVAQALMRLGITPADIQMNDKPTSISGYASDVADGDDRLGIKREARVFAAVLGASKVKPPIAVGLLGTWGSGKSFFMHELKRQFVDVERRGRSGDTECCSNIVQIWFNAWHYIDTSLWANLTSTIFDTLDEELVMRAGAPTDADRTANERAILLADKARLQSERDAAGKDRSAAEAELQAIQEAHRALDDDNEVAARAGVMRIASAAVQAAGRTLDVQQAAADANWAALKFANDYGLDKETVETMRGTAGRVRGLYLAVKRTRGLWTWVLLSGIVLGSLGFALVPQLRHLFRYAGSLSVIGGIGGVTWFVSLVMKYLPEVDRVVKKLDAYFQAKDKLISTLRKEQSQDLAERSKVASERLSQAKGREQEAEKELRLKERSLMELQPIQQMKSFVRERRDSTDYTQHLGVIAHAHEDFDRLSRYLATVQKPDENGVDQPLVDRIVLYIDDLDRCPEANVVEVLQAVHLLLAFPLFVVVVGVDSRWLLHSLQTRMAQFQVKGTGRDDGDPIDRAVWESTPINYLEKIFQVPFTLKPMASAGFEDLIDDLAMSAEARATTKTISAPDSLSENSPNGAQRIAINPSEQVAAAQEIVPDPALFARDRSTATPYLNLTSDEIEYMKVVYPLMPSPRGAKRFVNLYRLFRGLVDDYNLNAYLNIQTREYEAALLLLAMLIGFPEETTDVLETLVASTQVATWWTFISALVSTKSSDEKVPPTAKARWIALGAKLTEIRTKGKRPDETRSCAHFSRCARDVARFSFHSGRVISDYRWAHTTMDNGIVAGQTPYTGPSLHPTP